MGEFARCLRHGLHPMFLILFSFHSETSPREETCSFQADDLCKNKMYEAEFAKRKRERKDFSVWK